MSYFSIYLGDLNAIDIIILQECLYRLTKIYYKVVPHQSYLNVFDPFLITTTPHPHPNLKLVGIRTLYESLRSTH